jgi:hypothetical protein
MLPLRWALLCCHDGVLRAAAMASSALPRRHPLRFSDGILHPAATASSVLPRRVLRAAGMTSSVLPRRHRPRCWDGILRSLPVARFVPSNTHLCPFDVPSNALVCPPPTTSSNQHGVLELGSHEAGAQQRLTVVLFLQTKTAHTHQIQLTAAY